ncbi:MAG: SET domain-containing protein [Candidatus Izimaplasma sp.]|nr:SET domain-containing protein [Candidatus Izimaplasma bacterium]
MKNRNYPIINNIQNTYIQASGIDGEGLFSNAIINKGEILCQLDGQKMSWDFFDRLKQLYDKNDDFLFGEWNALDKDTLLVRAIRTKYSYINHSRDPNLKLLYNPLRIISLNKIPKNTELTLDYRKEPLRKEYIERHGKYYL